MNENTYNLFTKGLDNESDGARLTAFLNKLSNNQKAILNGDITLACDPATLGSSEATVTSAIAGDGFSRTVTVTLKDTDGNAILYNGTKAVAVAVDTAGDGTANILDSAETMTFVNGVGTVVVEYTATWAENDTCTLTVTGGEVAGNTVSNATSVDTLVA